MTVVVISRQRVNIKLGNFYLPWEGNCGSNSHLKINKNENKKT